MSKKGPWRQEAEHAGKQLGLSLGAYALIALALFAALAIGELWAAVFFAVVSFVIVIAVSIKKSDVEENRPE